MNSPHNIVLKPVRKIKPGNRSITGKRPSLKTNRSHPFESTLERDYLTLLEFDNEVESYVVQPVTIHYIRENKSARYTPDIAVFYLQEINRKPLLVEIKYEAELLEKRTLLEPKFTAAKAYALDNGFEFKVISEKEIRTEYLENIKFLSRYQQSSADVILTEAITNRFDQQNQLTAQQLIMHDDQKISAGLLHTVWTMLARNILQCDMEKKICMTTILWKKQK